MSSILGTNQSPRVNGYLNTVNDPAPGALLASPSGMIVPTYGGQMGGKLTLNSKEALALSDTVNIGTLYGGVYQYVQFLAGTTAAPARGTVCYWSDRENYVVTPDVTAVNQGKVAGIYIGAPTKGNYGFIQIAGKATVKFKASLTKVAADGDLVLQDTTPTNTGNVILDATALLSQVLKTRLGIALEAPTDGGLKLVALDFNGYNY